MSMVFAVREKDYSIILTDNMGFRSHTNSKEKFKIAANKLFRLPFGLFAAAVGNWEVYTEALNEFSLLLKGTYSHGFIPVSFLCEDLLEEFSRIMKSKKDNNSRVYLVLKGSFNHSVSVEQGNATTLAVFEKKTDFRPTYSNCEIVITENSLNEIANSIWNNGHADPIRELGPLVQIRLISAIHKFVSEMSPNISNECNMVIIGHNGYNILRGCATNLPSFYLVSPKVQTIKSPKQTLPMPIADHLEVEVIRDNKKNMKIVEFVMSFPPGTCTTEIGIKDE